MPKETHFNVIYTFTESQIVELHQLYKNEWWTKDRTLEETRACLSGSQVCIGLTNNKDKLIGFVRVITDFVFKALIFDLIIDEKHRGEKLGKKLISLLKNHKSLSSVSHFELYCLAELEDFYKQLGFSDDINGIHLLRHTNHRSTGFK